MSLRGEELQEPADSHHERLRAQQRASASAPASPSKVLHRALPLPHHLALPPRHEHGGREGEQRADLFKGISITI